MISPKARVDPTAHVDSEAQISGGCVIGPCVQVYGKTFFSRNVWVETNVIVYGPVEIGEESYIGSNSLIGFPSSDELEAIRARMDLRPKLKGNRLTKLGARVTIRSNCVIYSGLEIGNGVRFGHNVTVRENVNIGEETLIGTNSVVDGYCKIGRKVSIQTGVYMPKYSIIEDHVFLGPNCVLTNDLYMMQKEYKLKGPTIKSGASVGANATIFPAVTVGEGAVIGAGAVVRDDVAARTVVAGVPAKKIKNVPHNWHIPQNQKGS